MPFPKDDDSHPPKTDSAEGTYQLVTAPAPPPSRPSEALGSSKLRSPNGWDGKLRHSNTESKSAVLANPEALSDPDNYSDEENVLPPEQIDADEDLLEGEDLDTDQIDLVHCRISTIPALHLERFSKVERLCLRQNAIQEIDLPDMLGENLAELDLYDNLIGRIRGLDQMTKLKVLDLSFNKIRHVKNLSHLEELKELYFVQNRITVIEGLDSLNQLKTLELGGNRIREIENLSTLSQLEELWLGKNKITEIRNISSLQNLRLLDIKSNRLTSISGLESLTNLEELYLSHNAITSILPSSLEYNMKLRVLDISNNDISHLENISHLTHLEELWASSNQLTSFKEVEKELHDKKELATVYFEMNPLQLAGPAVYRNKVRLALPQVRQIDATFVKVS